MKILFVCKHWNNFIETDYKLLSKHFEVEKFYYKNIFSIPFLLYQISKCDLIFVWFLSLHTFFSCFNRKIKIFVAGGYDVAKADDIRYGLYFNRITRWMVQYCINKSNLILTVSIFNTKELRNNYNMDNCLYMLVNNCANDEFFKPICPKENNMVITVGSINPETWIRKGIKRFVDIAIAFNNLGFDYYNFVVIGKIHKDLIEVTNKIASKYTNIRFTDFISNEKLREYYSKVKIYCQLSYYESFGISVLESMLCNSIPVVTDKTALPEVIGGTGYKINENKINDPYFMKKIFDLASRIDGYKSSIYVMNHYSKEKRENKLKKIIEQL